MLGFSPVTLPSTPTENLPDPETASQNNNQPMTNPPSQAKLTRRRKPDEDQDTLQRARLPRIPLKEPAAEVVDELRQALQKFITDHGTPEPRVGFFNLRAGGHDISGVEAVCAKLVDVMEKTVMAQVEVSAESINRKLLCAGMQSNVEEFLVGLRRTSDTKSLSENEAEKAVHQCIELKHKCTVFGIQMDALRAGYSVS
jgi:hypothetical protein